uniref:Uncharacterized protein n=1 Tax=Arundo donax TaxID=35708 RepID=A0A0A9E0S5_ARUDO
MYDYYILINNDSAKKLYACINT